MATSNAAVRRARGPRNMLGASPTSFRLFLQRILLVAKRPERPVIVNGVPRAPMILPASARKSYREEYLGWDYTFKITRPLTYWLTETVPKQYMLLLEWADRKWVDITNVIDNMVIQRADRFPTGLKPWQYDSADELMLTANFNQLEEFVESVFAHRWVRVQRHKARKSEVPAEIAKWEKIDKQIGRYPLLHWKKYRNKEYALECIHTQMSMPPDEYDGKAEFFRTANVLCLYIWWTQVRPNRGSCNDVSGLTAFRERMDEKYRVDANSMPWSFSKMQPEEQEEYRQLMNLDDEIEKGWIQEDTDMLVRLVKERQNIWY